MRKVHEKFGEIKINCLVVWCHEQDICKFLELHMSTQLLNEALKKSFHLWKVVLVFAEKQGWGNFILKGLDRTVSIMVVQTSFLKSAFDPGIMEIWVVKFSLKGYKIRKILGQKST